MIKTAAVLLCAACLSGCTQIQYTGKEYTFAASYPAAEGYIELGCMYRTGDHSGCAGAVKRAGNPDDDIEDEIVNRGVWWLEQDSDGDEIKIRWDTGEIAYIPADKFDKDTALAPDEDAVCLIDLSC